MVKIFDREVEPIWLVLGLLLVASLLYQQGIFPIEFRQISTQFEEPDFVEGKVIWDITTKNPSKCINYEDLGYRGYVDVEFVKDRLYSLPVGDCESIRGECYGEEVGICKECLFTDATLKELEWFIEDTYLKAKYKVEPSWCDGRICFKITKGMVSCPPECHCVDWNVASEYARVYAPMSIKVTASSVVMECTTDYDCATDEQCVMGRCATFTCPSGYYIEDHRCIKTQAVPIPIEECPFECCPEGVEWGPKECLPITVVNGTYTVSCNWDSEKKIYHCDYTVTCPEDYEPEDYTCVKKVFPIAMVVAVAVFIILMAVAVFIMYRYRTR